MHEAKVRELPGLATGAVSTPLPVWAPDGRLVVAASDDGAARMVAWRPGDRRAAVLPPILDGVYGQPGMVVPLD